MERTTLFADVILPLPVPGLFTYRIPFEMNNNIEKWKRVVVQFGKKKIYTAIVVNIHEVPPQNYSVKYILSILDQAPVMNEIQFTFWQWISSYYLCESGEVMNVAIPSALKLASETQLLLNPAFGGNFDSLNHHEYLLAEALDIRKSLTISEVENIVGKARIIPLIKTLIEKGVILIEEELKEKFKPKMETWISLSEEFNSEDSLKEVFNRLEKKAFRQLEALMKFIELSKFGTVNQKEVKLTDLTKKVPNSTAAVHALIEKGILKTDKLKASRLGEYSSSSQPDSIVLNESQAKALDEIHKVFSEKKTALLHGVTSSGKTEIYIRLIQEYIEKEKQVLYLLPEIALTTQIINRLRKYFGNKVGVYHSKHNENERVEIWNNVLDNRETKVKFSIILGPRSALFLPFSNLGLVIVDEEHDYSYKQYDPAPRYNARDAAVFLAGLHGADVLLGSATPSLESYFNARSGKYVLVELKSRYGDIQMPEIQIADIRSETRDRTMHSHFSSALLSQINAALKSGEQIILFQNRRGFSLRLECDTCNWIPECKHCDVTLIYHKHNNQLKCHYCGYTRRVPERCDSCGSAHLQMKGFGTEKVEDELTILYPDVRIRRMDLDTTRSKHAYQSIINDFEERRIDILVGTQMVTKGLDFDNVSVVGILNADSMISYPDFRSYERSFQLMAQVSGRAGRKNKRGKVIIQAYNPKLAVIRDVVEHDYLSMYQSQILERRNFRYPPFYRLISLSLKHKDARLLNEAAHELAILLRQKLQNRILGPEYPLVSKIKNLFIKNILVKLEKSENLREQKKTVMEIIGKFKQEGRFKGIRVVVDVDPV